MYIDHYCVINIRKAVAKTLNIWIYFYFSIFWLYQVFIAAHGLSLVAEGKGLLQLQLAGVLLQWLLLLSIGSRVHGLQQLQNMGSVAVACRSQSTSSVVVAHRLSCSSTCGVFPDQGSNPCPLHQQADSYLTIPLGKSKYMNIFLNFFCNFFL